MFVVFFFFKLVFLLLHFITGSQNKLVWKEHLEDIWSDLSTYTLTQSTLVAGYDRLLHVLPGLVENISDDWRFYSMLWATCSNVSLCSL